LKSKVSLGALFVFFSFVLPASAHLLHLKKISGDWMAFLPGIRQEIALYAQVEGPRGFVPWALSGQILVDPDNPAALVYNRPGPGRGLFAPCYLCGPGDPEGFLYRGKRNPDGTRTGDQAALIAKLKRYGGNCIYLMAVRSNGGDGDSTQNPFVDSDPAKGLCEPLLRQWETWFKAMDEAGITIFFFFYDDDASLWDTGDEVCEAEKRFIQGLVRRFDHHRHLIWCVAEESEERFSSARVRKLAALIASTDRYHHPIADHHHSGVVFKAYETGCALSEFAMQYNVSTPEQLHQGVIEARQKARGRYGVIMAEAAGHGTGRTMRLKNWACGIAGASVMVLGMDIASTTPADLRACRFQQRFFEATDFNRMTPHDELACADTKWVLASEQESYIAYSPDLDTALGLREVAPGSYRLRWLDCVSGRTLVQYVDVKAPGEVRWTKPAGFGKEVALYARRLAGL